MLFPFVGSFATAPLHDDSVWHSASSLAVHLETSVGMFPSPAHRRKIGKSRRSFRTSRVQIMNKYNATSIVLTIEARRIIVSFMVRLSHHRPGGTGQNWSTS